MPLLRSLDQPVVRLTLNRDLARSLRRGHPWVFSDAVHELPPAPPGSLAALHNGQGRVLTYGFYDPGSPLCFRACAADAPPDETWAETRLQQALALRRQVLSDDTTGYRLCNGEGDGMPGLVCDVYGDCAVLRLDGPGPAGFWDAASLAGWISERLGLACVMERAQRRAGGGAKVLLGDLPQHPVPFIEHGVSFTADVVRGQKTGFFLDQRENRRLIGSLAAGRRVLNLFGYTGGFSVYAGLGGGRQVCTVDLAAPAIKVASQHWSLNHLPHQAHEPVVADAFAFLAQAEQAQRRWELVVADPPSFAPSQAALPQAQAAYRKLATACAGVTAPGGLLALASCSSHVDLPLFLRLCEEGLDQARRHGQVLNIAGLPADHPTPLALPESRYLKFLLLVLD